jgi:hypothetical protein
MNTKKLVPLALKSASLLVGSSILFAGAIVSSTPANALSVTEGGTPCVGSGYNIADNVTGASACEIAGTANQDFLNTDPLTVNAESFFGVSNWVFGGRTEYNDQTGQSGTYNITNPDRASWEAIMLIFKSGQGTRLVGYLLQDDVYSGTWNTPFTSPPFNFNGNANSRAVSHISIYYKPGSAEPIPTPAMLPGLIGLGVATWRKHRANAKEASEA